MIHTLHGASIPNWYLKETSIVYKRAINRLLRRAAGPLLLAIAYSGINEKNVIMALKKPSSCFLLFKYMNFLTWSTVKYDNLVVMNSAYTVVSKNYSY